MSVNKNSTAENVDSKPTAENVDSKPTANKSPNTTPANKSPDATNTKEITATGFRALDAPPEDSDGMMFRQKLASRCTGNLSAAIRDIPADLVAMSDAELERAVLAEKKCNEKGVDIRTLRLAFWREYGDALAHGRSINTVNICSGVASNAVFTKICKSRPATVAYMTQPVADAMLVQTRLHEKATDRVDEILDQKIAHVTVRFERDELGENQEIKSTLVDVKLANLQFKIWKELQARVAGPVEQRILHAHGRVPDQALQGGQPKYSGVEIQNRLADIEKQLAAVDQEEVDEVTPLEVEATEVRDATEKD